uniref:Neurexin-3a n=1 Tax=Haemonchus contortus TaxID=6289 RepID=A0A7I4Z531_HAECO
MICHCTGGWLAFILVLVDVHSIAAIILSGAPNSYARYPKWAHSFENSLSFEFKTKQSHGLLLYTDDGGVNGNFYSISISDGRVQLDFRLGDNANDFGSRRVVNTIRIEEVRVDDDRWHSLALFQSWENVKMELDASLVFKILNQRSFIFGNILKNSDVFVGGVPQDTHLLPVMSSPLRRYARHLAGNIRNLVYRLYPQGVTSPQLLDVHGARQNEDDYCRPTGFSSREQFVCRNGGRCYSTNEGPKCDCTLSEYDGKHCETEKLDSELTFSGQEWVGYDVSETAAGPLKTKAENFSLSFKTVHGSAMIFFAGDERSYMQLYLEEGALIASSKFAGTAPRLVRIFNELPRARFDDDSWHTVSMQRTLQMLTLTVDGRKDEIRQYAPELDWIGHSFAYLGSVPLERHITGVTKNAFRGCMKQVKYDADAQRILFVTLADQGFGGSIIKTGGELSFSCKSPTQPPDVLSFHSGSSFLALPKWGALASGSLSFHFRTTEKDGLLLYHGNTGKDITDYIAFELIDGHLHMIINLGSGAVRLQTTARHVSEGDTWHSLHVERVGRTGSVIVDSMKTDFNTPGVSSNLIVDDPIYLGWVPNTTVSLPSTIWSVSLRKGFIGCIKNLRVNGISARIATVFEHSNATGISIGCPPMPAANPCANNPCHNFGICEQSQNTFTCDCAATDKEGPTCNVEPTVVELTGERLLHILPYTLESEAETIEIRFRTDYSRGVLLSTKSNSDPKNQLLVYLNGSSLGVLLRHESGEHVFNWGSGISDNRWHFMRYKRRGEKVLLYFDGKWQQNNYLSTLIVLKIDEISSGVGLRKGGDTLTEPFRGAVTRMMFNGIDLLQRAKREGKMSKEGKGQRNIKPRPSSVSFVNTTGYAVLSHRVASSLTGSLRVSFKFQTLIGNALLLASYSADKDTSLVIELVNARIRFTYKEASTVMLIESPVLPNRQHLSDMRWHTLLYYQEDRTGLQMLLVDNTTAISDNAMEPVLGTVIAIGGAPVSAPLARGGFRGCLAALRINDRLIDVIDDCDVKKDVVQGCAGPLARCSPAACSNRGRCIQQWNSIRCDCTLTAHAGDRCQDPATTASFSAPSTIYFEYPMNDRPSTSRDYMLFAFRTSRPNGVLLSIDCAVDQDYFTVYIDEGFLQVKYNLGSREHHFGHFAQKVSDGKKHTVRIHRNEANVTLQIDGRPAIRYRPKGTDELVTLNMQWRVSLGASLNSRHIDSGPGRYKRSRRRKSVKIIDPFDGEISGVNYNGIMILDLHAQGSSRVHSVGNVINTHIANPVRTQEQDVMQDFIENPSEALIESIGPGCLSIEDQENCYIEPEETGFFTPILPSAATAPRRAVHSKEKSTSTAATFSTFLSVTTAKLAKSRTTPSFTVYPVRPTTPMGDLITSTMKASEAADFPRTALISIASVSVIMVIAVVVFCVFRCRQSPPLSDHYPMVCNGKSQQGYTSIAPELSPPLGTDHATQPLLGRPAPQMNGNGYQSMKGALITNGNGMNGHVRNGAGGGGGGGVVGKKDFKEWYV